MSNLPRALVLALGLVTAGCPPAPSHATGPVTAAAQVDARRQQLRALIAEQWEYSMRTAPEWASSLGDKCYDDRWSDYSEAFAHADLDAVRGFATRLEAIDTTAFPEQEQLDKTLLLRTLKLQLDGARFESWLMPVTQLGGPHVDLPQIATSLAFDTVKDYDDYLARLRAVPKVLDQGTAAMRAGVAKGLIPPKILLGMVATQTDAVAAAAPSDSPFALPLAKFPAGVPEAERARIRTAVLAAIRDDITPAYHRFAAFVRTEYEPRGRAEIGEWSLPLGAARYAFDIQQSTTTTMTADEIHALGLREVARIEAEMIGVARKLGYADLPAFAAAMTTDPARHFHSRDEVLARYRGYLDQIYPKLPAVFGKLPKGTLEVVPIEEFREAGAPGANYESGAPDGSRPGRVHINTGGFATRATQTVETTAYHEGVPGHHLQLTIAQEITGLPPFRQHYFVNAYVEGWALYAERLGEELGGYQDPYSYYGHLQDEMLRAIRLVVDTGLHAKHWTRQQAVDFFHAHSTSDEVEVQSETDRYIAIPGQALGYKLGQLRILALRDKAKQALGARFDLRAFHDTILGAGALPLDVLEARVDAWIAVTTAAAR